MHVSSLHCFAQSFGEYDQTYYSPGYQNYQSGFGGVSPQQYQQPVYQQPQVYRQSPQYAQSAYQPHTTMNALEHELDAVDSNWNQVPVAQPMQNYSAPRQQSYPQQNRSNYSPQRVTRGRSSAGPGNGTIMRTWQGMFPGMSKQELMRVFLEGGTPESPGSYSSSASAPDLSGQYASARSTAYNNYQTATNENTKARNEANTAHYNHDKWTRKSAADRAEYAANNAQYAAERAESAANNGDAQARHYASLARQEANRARASANQARYNANTIQ